MRSEEGFIVEKIRLSEETRRRGFIEGLFDGDDVAATDAANVGPNRLEGAADAKPGGERRGEQGAESCVALAEPRGCVDVGVRAEAIERQCRHRLVARVNLESKVFVGVKIAKVRAAS